MCEVCGWYNVFANGDHYKGGKRMRSDAETKTSLQHAMDVQNEEIMQARRALSALNLDA